MVAQRTRDGRPLSHWSVVGHDENGDLDGEVCRCEISDNHFTDGRPWPVVNIDTAVRTNRIAAAIQADVGLPEAPATALARRLASVVMPVVDEVVAEERRRWLNWLATTGYGQDFTHDDEPPCTPRELAEVLNERQPLDQDATPGYTTGVDLWLWTLAECTGYGRCDNCGGDPARCDCDES